LSRLSLKRRGGGIVLGLVLMTAQPLGVIACRNHRGHQGGFSGHVNVLVVSQHRQVVQEIVVGGVLTFNPGNQFFGFVDVADRVNVVVVHVGTCALGIDPNTE